MVIAILAQFSIIRTTVEAWQQPHGTNFKTGSLTTWKGRGTGYRSLKLSAEPLVSAAEPSISSSTATVPYHVSRGDGSTGGGGLPMPQNNRNQILHLDNDELVNDDLKRRPKVGAEMPHGRPSWFRVPAPSQCTLWDTNIYCLLIVRLVFVLTSKSLFSRQCSI